MFLWQKHKYHLHLVNSEDDLISMKNVFDFVKPKIVVWDTETTGLHIVKDVPFLMGIGFLDHLYVFEPKECIIDFVYDMLKGGKINYFIAHNAKFDYHMMRNINKPLPEEIPIACSLALARLTDYVDTLGGHSLEALGKLHVDKTSKFASQVIKEHLKQINLERRKLIKQYVKENLDITYTAFMEHYKNKVQFVETPYDKHFEEIDKIAPRANYLDSYLQKPTLMINYLADDLVILDLVVKELLPVLNLTDPNRRTWHRENKLIRVVGDMESNGLRVDIDYLLKSRSKVFEEIKQKYKELLDLTGLEFSVGQHAFIKKMFANVYKIGMLETNANALEEIISKQDDEDAKKVAKLILEIRSLEKVRTTYIEGMLNRIVGDFVYSDINNSGTVTGRVTSDLQQQPKEATKNSKGEELFHPRRAFINREGYTNYYIDFNSMEMRVQAFYTFLVSGGDLNLCRAFIPFKCTHAITGEKYNPFQDMNRLDEPWVYDDGKYWKPVDLHTATTLKAFPELTVDSPDFDHYRELGKRVNFLKNYGGGKIRIMESLGLSEDIATALNNGYYKAFPKVLDYQRYVDTQVRSKGFIENLYGRRYYFSDPSWSYRGYNYLIQGSCADYVKEKEIELAEFLKNYESKMLLPIHDEIIFEIKKGEEHIVPDIKKIMEDAEHIMDRIPMVSTVTYSNTNWAEGVEL